MRIFVAGATGTIGRRLVPLLAAQGHEVTALTRHPSVGVPGSSAVVAGDVYDAARLREVVAEARAEVVIHQLTDLGARDFAANNRIRREGTRNLVDAALAAGVRRVISQSIAWAYEPGDTPADEDTPLDLQAADDTRRATVEAVHALETITAEAPEWVVLRYGLFYGPGTWYTAGALMADLAAAGKLPTGPDITSFVHVDDAATATAAALTWPTGPVNIVDNTPAPASTWAPAFTHSLGLTPNTPPSTTPPYAGAPADSTPRTPWARGASNARARALGWSPAHPTCFSG
ncbi:NAD-dependent epimerase/dehydratase family protein [Kribbella sp. HUAS MG21]|uniref:NAD-dependent epimerase/dehydratase family protein n=1 Tax=Kribbella sp. HUAS MG21 TaxID=3160966 RepID=A0AAU7TNX9_9ACTN